MPSITEPSVPALGDDTVLASRLSGTFAGDEDEEEEVAVEGKAEEGAGKEGAGAGEGAGAAAVSGTVGGGAS